MLRYSFALRSRSGLQRQQQQQRQQRQQAQKDHLITGCQEGGRTRGPRQQTSRPSSSSFLRQGSQRLNLRSFFSTFPADTATATATANALVATVPLLLLLSLSNALFYPIFSAAFFVLWFSVLFFPPSSSYGRPYGLQRRQEQAGFSFLFLPSFPFFVFRPAYAVGSTRPEGLGGSRDAGPAVAGPRPPYVTEAVRHSGCTRRLRLRLRHGYAVQRLRPYGPYGPYEGRNVG
ncbi:hypothetical protein L249_8135 [Ophiocordyceps polyrhachis-furcata BCC 54312]|uniref:Uncharacterized protein n=1 Tax=Ophiocordyceps polyrhachis-furcata BCC 54312 TaxID=1330021 RepID=A0A367LHW8_9HYPO|nr:hypothetical protein L249_8135 [Ophiocordyceps polyrhachis-furcata BCC 54312]